MICARWLSRLHIWHCMHPQAARDRLARNEAQSAQGGHLMINVVLVDDHELVRTGFRMILQQQADLRVRGEAGTAEEGLRLIRTLAPDIALGGVNIPGMRGGGITRGGGTRKTRTKNVIFPIRDECRLPK